MSRILNITNGDCAVSVMEEAGIRGEFLPWRDVLHDGPVPAGLKLEELSQVRAQFIIERGWGTPEDIRQDFTERDRLLATADSFDKVILWFEHDLYDQLQLLQLLDWFNQNPPEHAALSIICTDRYLGPMTPEEMAGMPGLETPVTGEQLALASRAWTAFRESTPLAWQALLETDTDALPFLAGTVTRQLEEYPACDNGLSRTARQALEIIAQGTSRPGRLFGEYQQTEERRFLGDAGFRVILREMLDASPPLLELPAGEVLTLPLAADPALTIAAAGKDVMSGRRHWLDMIEIDRWIGGVHLTVKNCWCRDAGTGAIARR